MQDITISDLSILLIEPSSMQSSLIKQKLIDEGIQYIDTATGMNTALEKINKYPPDLIFSNLYYEDGMATQLLQSIRQQEQFTDLPFVLVSSENRRNQLEIFKQSGVLAILSKPFSQKDLKAALNATLSFLNKTELHLENYDIESLRVIVVDDSLLARKAISKVLSNFGIQNLMEFDDGSGAIEYLQENEVDLVVTDYNMPDVDGAELTKFIRQSPQHTHVPVLMVTSESKDSHLQFISEAGVSAISDKPFNAASVKNLLIDILDH